MGIRTVLHRFKIEPVKIQMVQPEEQNNGRKYFSFILGTLLSVSETLPFFKDVKANGILDSVLRFIVDKS
jgi:hypothetical protein